MKDPTITRDLTITLRDQQVTIKNIGIGSADTSVGIMSDHVEEYTLHDAAGDELDWYDSLTKDEIAKIDETIYSAMREYYDAEGEADSVFDGDWRPGDYETAR